MSLASLRTPPYATYLNAQRLVDRQDLEHEGEVPLSLQIPQVMRVCLQKLDEENTSVALFSTLNEVSGFGHDSTGAIRVCTHPQLGVRLVLVVFEALVLQHLELGNHAVLSSLAPGIVLDGAIQSPHDVVVVVG